MLKFSKLHGLGNDFILFDGIDEKLPNYSELAKKVCHRNFGIGADGILVIENSDIADIKMIIYNSDGSQASMCGNGMRCFAKYVYDNGYVKSKKFSVETLAGIINCEVFVENGEVTKVKVNLGKPVFTSDLIPECSDGGTFINHEIEIDGVKYSVSTLIVGCVHTVLFFEDLDSIDIAEIGPIIEKHPLFPTYTNVDFCKIIDNNNIVVKTWEIGAGQTMACGTGAASAAVISRIIYNTNKNINVHLPGGIVKIELEDDSILMTGPTTLICTGVYNWE